METALCLNSQKENHVATLPDIIHLLKKFFFRLTNAFCIKALLRVISHHQMENSIKLCWGLVNRAPCRDSMD